MTNMQRVVLTLMHYRYTRETLAEDLTFRRADPLAGGRGLEATQFGRNNFLGRYAILHEWSGQAKCEPIRGRWGERKHEAKPQVATNTLLTGIELDLGLAVHFSAIRSMNPTSGTGLPSGPGINRPGVPIPSAIYK